MTGEIKETITNNPPTEAENKLLHKTIKKITNDIEDGDMKFNTSIAQMMIFINELYKIEKVSKEVIEKFLILLSPFTPHICEELWELLGNKGSIQNQPWLEYDEALAKSDMVTIALSVNGKVRSKKEVDFDTNDKDLEQIALDDESIKRHILGKDIVKIIVVKNRMVNVVVK